MDTIGELNPKCCAAGGGCAATIPNVRIPRRDGEGAKNASKIMALCL
jgi:hypothetical protein